MEQMRTWCSLHHDLLSLILSYLLAGDIIAFLAVCKWWKATPLPVIRPIPTPSFPFLLLPSNKLFHPIYKYSHSTQVYEISRAVFRASHCGWLLMTKVKKCIFFFSPFTNETVELPDMPFTHRWPRLTFSSPPTSPDCLVFVVQREPTRKDKINIYTSKPGQPNWTKNTIDSTPYFELSSCNPIMFKGLYYCLGKGGSLLIYNFVTKKIIWRGPPEPSLHHNQTILGGHQYYMVESQGELLLVFMDREGTSVNVARYTTKMSIWDKVDNLGDTMLFVSQVTSFSAKSEVRGTGNKIYFTKFVGETDDQLFYSLATRKYHCLLGGRSWKNIWETRSYANSTWIQP